MTVKFDAVAFQNKIMGIISYKRDETVARKVGSISKTVSTNQNTFFPLLSKLIIKATKAPSLNGYGEPWAPLSSKYTSYRLRKTRGQIKEGMFYRGLPSSERRLATTLPKQKSMSVFGAPTVEVWKEGTYGRSRIKVTGNYASYIKTGKRIAMSKVKNIVSHIALDLFPNIEEDVSKGTLGPHLGKYLPDDIAYKLTNNKGTEKRPVITPYIRWWINVHMKQLIRARL